MRHFIAVPALFLLLALAACGSTATTPVANGDGTNTFVISSATGGPGVAPAASTETPNTLTLNLPTPGPAATGLTMNDVAFAPATDGTLKVTGKVVNQGPTEAHVTRISIQLVSDSGEVLAQSSTSNVKLAPVVPGDQVAWQGQTKLKPADGQTLRVVVEGEVAN